jgi:uncharacterized phage-like protein YoqJ
MRIAIISNFPYELDKDYDLKSNLSLRIRQELERVIRFTKPKVMLSGMNLGIDTMWAKLAIEHEVELLAVLPCIDQSAPWNEDKKQIYETILTTYSKIDIYYTSEEPYMTGCFERRNKWLIDNCDLLVAVFNNRPGIAHQCVTYANKQKRKTLFINPDKLKV